LDESVYIFSTGIFIIIIIGTLETIKAWDASHKLQYTPLDHVESDLRY